MNGMNCPAGARRLKARQGVRYPSLEGVMVADTETLEPVPRDGETMGEIFMRGNTVAKGYLKNPDGTDKAFKGGGWYHTGDLAVWHADGYGDQGPAQGRDHLRRREHLHHRGGRHRLRPSRRDGSGCGRPPGRNLGARRPVRSSPCIRARRTSLRRTSSSTAGEGWPDSRHPRRSCSAICLRRLPARSRSSVCVTRRRNSNRAPLSGALWAE